MAVAFRPLRLRAEAARITAAADRVRRANPDLADLLEAVAWGCQQAGTPPALTEQEMFRWTRAVVTARRIADRRPAR